MLICTCNNAIIFSTDTIFPAIMEVNHGENDIFVNFNNLLLETLKIPDVATDNIEFQHIYNQFSDIQTLILHDSLLSKIKLPGWQNKLSHLIFNP